MKLISLIRSRVSIKIALISGILLMLCLGAIYILTPRQAHYIEAKEQSYVPSLLLSGEVVAIDSGKVLSKVAAPIKELKVRKGERVHKGELLAVLDAETAEADVDSAQASLDYSRNHLANQGQLEFQNEMDASNRRAQAATLLSQSELRLQEAEQKLIQTDTDYARAQSLYEAGAISQQALEQARLQRDNALNSRDLAVKDKELARLQLEAIQEQISDIAMLQSEVDQKQAQLSQAKARLDDYYIYSPIDGQITDVFKLESDQLMAGETLLDIASTDRTRVLIKPDQRYSGMVLPGCRAEIWSQASPDQRYTGSIVYVKPAWDASKGIIEAEVALDANLAGLPMGALVTVQLFAPNEQKALIIPQNYLAVQGGKAGLWIFKDGGPIFVEIITGEGNNNGIIIRSGLFPGDKILYPDDYTPGEELELIIDDTRQ